MALALNELSETCTADMCRDLARDVAKLLTTSTSYIYNKVIFSSIRIERKVPETITSFSIR